MSQDRTVHTIQKPGSTKSDSAIIEESRQLDEQILDPEVIKKRFASVLERGFVHDRLAVDLPPDVHGEWVRHDAIAIADYKSLGFKVDDTYAPKRSLHGASATEAVIGDVIFMTCPKWIKELLDEEKRKYIHARYNPKKPVDESAYESNVKQSTGGVITPTNESRTETVNADDISDALAAMERQALTSAQLGG